MVTIYYLTDKLLLPTHNITTYKAAWKEQLLCYSKGSKNEHFLNRIRHFGDFFLLIVL